MTAKEFWPDPALGYRQKIPFWTRQQLEAFERSVMQRHFALWMEPRTGKSKPCVDTACYHYEHKESPLHITGVLIVAWPSGAAAGWIVDAFPDNVPDRIQWKGFLWDAGKANGARKVKESSYRNEFAALCKFNGLAVFAINAESLTSDECKKYVAKFLKARGRVMAIGDESSFFATPNARRNRTMQSIGERPESVIKRVLDGTPADKAGPLDFYTQVKFLSPRIFGIATAAEFRARYAVMETQGDWEWRDAKKKGLAMAEAQGLTGDAAILFAERHANGTKGKHWPAIAEDENGMPRFQNMDDFWRRMEAVSYRATFAECFPDASHPVYAKKYFYLTPEQRRVYDQLRDEFKTETQAGQEISAAHQLTRIMRLQQVASNFYPGVKSAELHEACEGGGCPDCEDGIIYHASPAIEIDPGRNPRIQALEEELREGMPTIAWCRFRQDADDCFALGQEMCLKPVRYDGTVGKAAQLKAKDDFQGGRSDFIVANASSAGRGIPLWRAAKHVFYSNTFSYRTRKQAEDRAEHGAKTTATRIVDLVAIDTVDDQLIIPALRANMDVAAWVLRDKKREWL